MQFSVRVLLALVVIGHSAESVCGDLLESCEPRG